MSSRLSDPYRALGVEKDADVAAIKSAYRKLVLKCHPDKVQDPTLKAAKQDEFQRVQQAYEILVDENKRKEYDLNVKMRKLREEVVRNMARPSAASHTSPKAYAEYHVRTAEPPPSFKPGPPPSPYSPYQNGSTPHSHPYDREIPVRNRNGYDDGHRARRAASYEKPRETTKEERRRQKDDDVEPSTSAPAREREWMREKDHEREKERDKKTRSDRDKDDKRERQKNAEKRERERDRLRRQEQQEKYRSKKAAYVEPYDESEDEVRASKKKTANGGSNSKKHADTPRREKPARRDDSPPVTETPTTDMIQDKMKRAADYMVDTRRRGSKSNTTNPHFAEGMAYNSHFPDPDMAWHAKGETPRPRRTSPDEKKFRSRADADDDVDQFMSKSDRRPPRLSKSYTSPIGNMHVANSSAPRIPSLNRAATMDYPRAPPQAPAAPPPDTGRSKTEHRRKGSFDVHDDDLRPRRSSTNPRVVHYPLDESSQAPRTTKPPYYKHGEDYFPSPSRAKTAALYPEQIYQTKRYSDEDIVYSTVNHSADHYPSAHPSYVGAYD